MRTLPSLAGFVLLTAVAGCSTTSNQWTDADTQAFVDGIVAFTGNNGSVYPNYVSGGGSYTGGG
ncbi:hypothetical protein, partial [Mesorhizobium sp.]|uniref:hypothetical protein n=1 Tax=Mesorhizobium sp. TaxID=1871066 RepID=UPI00257D6BC2